MINADSRRVLLLVRSADAEALGTGATDVPTLNEGRLPRTTPPQGRSPRAFFLLVLALSVPFWLIGALTGGQLSPDLPVGSFIWVCPVVAASILAYRANGGAGLTAPLKRSVGDARFTAKMWYAPAVLLLPGIHALTYGVMRALGLPPPTVQFPVLPALDWRLPTSSPPRAKSWAGRATPSTHCKRAGTRSAPLSSWGWSGPRSTSCRWSRPTARQPGSPGGPSARWRSGS
jgi:hypothetical protein